MLAEPLQLNLATDIKYFESNAMTELQKHLES